MIENEKISDFLDQLASKSSTPGGGSAAALGGAMGAALVSMVCNLTIGKKKYADVEGMMKALLSQSEEIRRCMLEFAAADIEAFNRVMAAYSMPKETEQEKLARSAALQERTKEAAQAPLDVARLCKKTMELSQSAAEYGNTNVVSDAGVAVLFAEASLQSAVLNVAINLAGIEDAQFKQSMQHDLDSILANVPELREKTLAIVNSKIVAH
jgi:methenyltetrahydrofolate cyclohydrolase